jgi:chain length determinant protein tyrosine kinase EpsG
MKPMQDLHSIDAAPPRFLARPKGSLGGILASAGKLESDDIERVLDLQRARGLRFGEAALRLGLITREDLERAIARQYDVPHPAGRGSAASELVIAYDPSHPSAEDVRALRTQLQIRWSGAAAAPRALAVVSPGGGEGRSYVAANLAVAFAQLGERTLLVDADLRAPRQHRIFGVTDRIGLSAALSGRAGREALAPVADFGPLSLLPAGARPPNPQELLSRPAFAELLRELRDAFDVILFDTPPARLYADAQGVAFRAGSALVLARKDQTRLADVGDVIRDLGEAGARVMGTVLNAR